MVDGENREPASNQGKEKVLSFGVNAGTPKDSNQGRQVADREEDQSGEKAISGFDGDSDPDDSMRGDLHRRRGGNKPRDGERPRGDVPKDGGLQRHQRRVPANDRRGHHGAFSGGAREA